MLSFTPLMFWFIYRKKVERKVLVGTITAFVALLFISFNGLSFDPGSSLAYCVCGAIRSSHHWPKCLEHRQGHLSLNCDPTRCSQCCLLVGCCIRWLPATTKSLCLGSYCLHSCICNRNGFLGSDLGSINHGPLKSCNHLDHRGYLRSSNRCRRWSRNPGFENRYRWSPYGDCDADC
jgi:hypothetical protein